MRLLLTIAIALTAVIPAGAEPRSNEGQADFSSESAGQFRWGLQHFGDKGLSREEARKLAEDLLGEVKAAGETRAADGSPASSK